ncbi:YbaK/prolyl-tRNA synthetase associated region [Pseudodesulfovibrio mercurii]|uniref:YbaK/prolyl-tRNA synthetase associated region n=1 Tax=Pseudodesulfovibrio mercurii TaxID=641491 RepID=F0JDI8_9BACT|nr:YbaK/EbsC family protein [Pseudodesulfovibrio mercurii]EGB13357.1 YbaK/prolyl-tRNA synthetase associated region [Pseudodesulfovibrio mercurii]
MADKLSRSAQNVQDFLSKQGDDFDVRELASSTRTAREAADSIGCSVAQIAKSLVFRERATGDPVLVVASGVNRVDPARVRLATGLDLGRADGNFVKDRTGFAIGGIPPVGHDVPLRTVLDRDLEQYAEIWAAAGTPHAVFRLTPDRLGALTGGQWVDLREES